MTLLAQNVQVAGQLSAFFKKIKEGTAPDKFTRQHLKDIDFKSSNHLAFIPLLKGLGFLSPDGTPTDRYKNYLDSSQSGRIMAEAMREAYSDIFVIKAKPTKSDKKAIAGKFRSTFNHTELTADRAASTFLALLELADKAALYGNHEGTKPPLEEDVGDDENDIPTVETVELPSVGAPRISPNLGLHYNIQIHLPASKDIEVYNAIFKSLKEHLVD